MFWRVCQTQLQFSHLLLRASVRPNTCSKFATQKPGLHRRCLGNYREWIPQDIISKFPTATTRVEDLSLDHVDQQVVLHGYLGVRSDITKSLSFAPLVGRSLSHSVQLISKAPSEINEHDIHGSFKSLKPNVPVAVKGVIQEKVKPKDDPRESEIRKIEDVEVRIEDVIILGDPVEGIEFQDHILQSKSLYDALSFRSKLGQLCRNYFLDHHGFTEIETPLLFKSTQEGAREFPVLTREKGLVYALPQSPQQSKQMLMARRIPGYFQIAKCFRDEDLRADRQPEFTQLDIEMGFATGKDVVSCIEGLMKLLWNTMLHHDLSSDAFPTLTYEESMSKYGSDKPDVRLGMEISRIGHMIPADLISKIGPLADPVVDILKFSVSNEPHETRKFVSSFMDSQEAQPFLTNPDGQPAIFIYDSRKPLGGLQPFGFEAAERVEEMLELEEGDMVVIQARPNASFSGGSTSLGNLRLALHRAAVEYGYVSAPTGWHFLWVTDFPLFSPMNNTDPGQGGNAGLCSTHHPFTAPKDVEDFKLLSSDPLSAKADHYDLILNGLELGGGSRRIHQANLQEYVFRDILKMPEDGIEEFNHLLEALRAGCPPHAGIALGFDRLCAVMLGKKSIRDVMAFPKSGGGQDPLVKSPSKLTQAQLDTYHLQLKQ